MSGSQVDGSNCCWRCRHSRMATLCPATLRVSQPENTQRQQSRQPAINLIEAATRRALQRFYLTNCRCKQQQQQQQHERKQQQQQQPLCSKRAINSCAPRSKRLKPLPRLKTEPTFCGRGPSGCSRRLRRRCRTVAETETQSSQVKIVIIGLLLVVFSCLPCCNNKRTCPQKGHKGNTAVLLGGQGAGCSWAETAARLSARYPVSGSNDCWPFTSVKCALKPGRHFGFECGNFHYKCATFGQRGRSDCAETNGRTMRPTWLITHSTYLIKAAGKRFKFRTHFSYTLYSQQNGLYRLWR